MCAFCFFSRMWMQICFTLGGCVASASKKMQCGVWWRFGRVQVDHCPASSLGHFMIEVNATNFLAGCLDYSAVETRDESSWKWLLAWSPRAKLLLDAIFSDYQLSHDLFHHCIWTLSSLTISCCFMSAAALSGPFQCIYVKLRERVHDHWPDRLMLRITCPTIPSPQWR